MGSNLHAPLKVHDPEDLSNGAATDGGIRTRQVGVVQCIENIPFELQVSAFPDGKGLR